LAMCFLAAEPGAGAKTRLTKGVGQLTLAMCFLAAEPGAGAKTRLTKGVG
jgi:hypothetical protein